MKKTIVSSVLVWMLMAFLLFGTVYESTLALKHRKESLRLEATIDNLNQQIRFSEIRLNDSVRAYQAQVAVLSMTKRNLEKRYSSLLKASKLKSKDVGQVTEVQTVVHKVDTVIAEVDTFGGLKANLSDPYVSIDVSVFPDRHTIIGYTVRDSLTLINVQKRRSWLFGLIKWKESKELRVINHNPNAIITHLQTLEVIE